MAPLDEGSDRRNSLGRGYGEGDFSQLHAPRRKERRNTSRDYELRPMQYNERSLGQDAELLYVR